MANNPCSVGKERPSAGSLSFSAEAARRAHNPEVRDKCPAGVSNPVPATGNHLERWFLFWEKE